MSKIIFVGDVHLKGSSPISRKDAYPEVILNKIRFLWDFATTIDCSTIIFLGDIFDTVNTSLQYFSHCLSLFKDMSRKGIDLYTIVGNHDIRYDSMDTLPITPLGILLESGEIKLLDSLTVDDVYIKGCHFPNKPIKNEESEIYSILLLHRFYESGFNEEPITKENILELNYDTYILGHDHRPYSTITLDNGVTIYRPGSLARNSSDSYNRLRKPRILIMDTDMKEFYYEEVPCEPGENVFFEKEAETQVVSMADLVAYLRSSYHTDNNSIRSYMDTVTMPNDVHDLIIHYLDALGA